MGIRTKVNATSELVKPKATPPTVAFNPPAFPQLSVPLVNNPAVVNTAPAGAGGGPKWSEFSLSIDLSGVEEIATAGKKFLTTLNTIIQVQQILLKILRLFSSDLKSLTRLLKGLIKAILNSIQAFIDSLLSTGIYVAPVYAEFDQTLPGFTLPLNGGFSEFKARIASLCLDRRDPTAPNFGVNDTVGGFVLCCGAGTNDPKLLNDLFKNMKLLAQFFGFLNPMPPPPGNIMAMAGIYNNKGTYKPGIKITWDNPGSGVSGFNLYRCPVYNGLKEIIVDNGVQKEISVYKDDSFNGGKPVEFSFLSTYIQPSFEYIDFNVTEGTTYNYQVFSTAGGFDIPLLKKATSPLGSKRVSATARNCIPLSELKKYLVVDVDGNPRDVDKFATGGWINLTIRDLLGAEIDDLMDLLVSFSQKISGSLVSAGSSVDKYITFISGKIQDYINTLTTVQNIAERLMQYRLQGTVLLLNLDAEKGGIDGFVNRVMQATVDPQTIVNLVGSSNAANAVGNAPAAPLISNVDTLDGIFVGVTLVYGFPSFDDQTIQSYVPQEQIESYKAQLAQTQKAIETFKSILGIK